MKYNTANYKRIGAAIFIVFFGIMLFISSFFIQRRTSTGLGPDFFPRLIAIVIVLLGGIELVNAVKGYKFLEKNGKLIPIEARKKSLKDLFYDNLDWVSGALIVVYVIGIYYLGFLLPSVIYMFVQILLYTTNKKRNYILYSALSIIIPAVIYYTFRSYFHLMLPVGILG